MSSLRYFDRDRVVSISSYLQTVWDGRALALLKPKQGQTMTPATQRDTHLRRLREELKPVERDRVSRGDVVTDSSEGWDGAVRLLRDWRRQYRGSVLCQK